MIHSVFPIPMYIGKIEDLDIELPFFGQNHVVSQVIPELRDKIFDIIGDMLEETGSVRQPLKLNDMWFNRYDNRRPEIAHHYHQNCAWTGTYIPQDANHTIRLFHPNMSNIMQQYPQQTHSTMYNSDKVHTWSEQGEIIIHPSWIGHEVKWNMHGASHSISFDVGYQLPIGDKDFGSYTE